MSLKSLEEIKEVMFYQPSSWFSALLSGMNVVLGKRVWLRGPYELTTGDEYCLRRFERFLEGAERGTRTGKGCLDNDLEDMRATKIILPFVEGENEEAVLYAVQDLRELVERIKNSQLSIQEAGRYMGIFTAISEICKKSPDARGVGRGEDIENYFSLDSIKTIVRIAWQQQEN